MGIREDLDGRIRAYLRATGQSASAFGIAAVGDGKFVGRLRSGKGVTLTTIERALQYIEDHPAPQAEPQTEEAA